jgi:sugar phosphate isomerase/epimerase
MKLKIGVAGLFPSDWAAIDFETCQRVRAAGFSGASVVIAKPLAVQRPDVQRVKQAMDAAQLKCAQANGWYECLINADPALRAEGVRGHQALTRIGRMLDAHCVYVRPGSHNPRGHWWHHAENHSQKTFDVLVESCKQIAKTAEQEGMTLAIEGHVSSTLDSPQRVRDLLSAVGSPALKFSMDPVNFTGTVADVHDTRRVLNALFDALARETAILHAKDCALQDGHVVHIDEVLLGTGTMDYGLLLTRLSQEAPNAYVLIEHLPDEQVPLARKAIGAAAQKVGLAFDA